MTPRLGGLLLNWRVFLCLNLGGPLRGEPGAVALVAAFFPDFTSVWATSRFILLFYWLVVC